MSALLIFNIPVKWNSSQFSGMRCFRPPPAAHSWFNIKSKTIWHWKHPHLTSGNKLPGRPNGEAQTAARPPPSGRDAAPLISCSSESSRPRWLTSSASQTVCVCEVITLPSEDLKTTSKPLISLPRCPRLAHLTLLSVPLLTTVFFFHLVSLSPSSKRIMQKSIHAAASWGDDPSII